MNDQNNSQLDALSQASQDQPSSQSDQPSTTPTVAAPVTSAPAEKQPETQDTTPVQASIQDNAPAAQTLDNTPDPTELNPVTGKPVTDVPLETASTEETTPATEPTSPLDNMAVVTPQPTPNSAGDFSQNASSPTPGTQPKPVPVPGEVVSIDQLAPLGTQDTPAVSPSTDDTDSSLPSPHPQPAATPPTATDEPSPDNSTSPSPAVTPDPEATTTSYPVTPATPDQQSPSNPTEQNQAQPGVQQVSPASEEEDDDDSDSGNQSGQPGSQSSPTDSSTPPTTPAGGAGQASANSQSTNTEPAQADTGLKGAGRYSVKVVGDKCIGAASCVAIAPKAFKLDDNQIAQVLDTVKDESDENLLLAAQSCPVLAIEVYDTQSNQKVWPK